LIPEWLCGRSKALLHLLWLWAKRHVRVFEPAVVNSPRLEQGERLVAHNSFVGEQSQESQLSVPGKMNPIIGCQERLPLPG
jgi:hypothetical protein